MTYDFDSVTDRRNSGSLKWDVPDGELPMWVADMDFKTAPEIINTLNERVSHGVFGYSVVPDEWYDAIKSWWSSRHGFEIEKEWLMFCTGVVPAISSIVRKLTTPAEKVLVMTPVYNIFFNSIYNNGRNILESPLLYDGESYSIDFCDLEKKLSDPQTTLMILCNPHNPVGKIWDKETLAKIGDLCKKHHVVVVSDEIHCDLTDPGKGYVPFASVSDDCRDNSVTCIAPTKTFNIAGLQTAAIYAADPILRHKVNRAINTDEVAEPNAFAIVAAIAAFTQGSGWLDALREYLYQNKCYVYEFVKEHIPSISVVRSEATYLLWLDCHKICPDTRPLAAFLRKEAKVYLSDGAQYGDSGKAFLRLNIACPISVLKDGLSRLADGIEKYIETSGKKQ